MNSPYMRSPGRVLCGGLVFVFTASSVALPPPTAEQVREYKANGTWAEHVAKAKELGNHKIDPYLVARTKARLNREYAKAAGLPAPGGADGVLPAPPSGWQGGLPDKGTPKALVILIDFPDYPHGATDTVEDVQNKFFGSGDPSQYPYDSLRNFYQRSSYDQLTIQGNVLGWYRSPSNRADIAQTTTGRQTLIQNALNYFNGIGHDFTQYDNDGNGTIDMFYVKWTGPDNGWANFWWAYQTGWSGTWYIDGKKPRKYVWSWIWNQGYDGKTIYQAHVDIHETGHALGLPDLYDYDSTVGPRGGVGGLDMMDGNWGDHNCFSKFMLEWLTPTFVVSGSQTLALNPSGTSKDCVLIMPSTAYTAGAMFDEFFMAQYRKRSAGNDAGYPTDGYTIWHIDSTLSGSSFAYDNSTTAHKYIRLMEADGLEQIEAGGSANAGDFYVSSKAFGDNTTPNSKDYSGAYTHVLIDQFTPAGTTMGARFTIQNTPLIAATRWSLTEEMCQPANQAIDPGETVTVDISLQNVGTVSTTNLMATLLPTGGVIAPSAAQNYGATTPGGPAVTRSFSFSADGDCGGTLTATLQLQDGSTSFPPVVFNILLGAPDGAGGYTCCWTPNLLSDFDGDGDVDQEDFGRFQACLTASGETASADCQPARMDLDADVDQADMALFKKCHTQQGQQADPNCRNL